MQMADFEQMVARLEGSSRIAPGAYRFKVALLALLGFLILGAIVGSAILTLLALVAIPFVLWAGGLHALGAYVWIGKLLLLLAVPFWFLVKSALSSLMTRFPVPDGLELNRAQAPALFDEIDTLRQAMKGPRFHHVLVSNELNAAVMQRPLWGLVGPPRNYLIVGLPLLECLTPQEALAVVAHEYGHLAGSHGRFGAYIYRLRNTWATVNEVSERWNGRIGALLRRVVGWYAPYFNAYTFVLARANEYEADAAAAGLVGAAVTANALKRVDVSAAHFGAFLRQTFETVPDSPAPPMDIAMRWASVAQQAPATDAQRWLERALTTSAGLSDTHPPLRDRLLALPGVDTASMTTMLASTHGPNAAQAWLGDGLIPVRRSVETHWQKQCAAGWHRQHEEHQEQRRRLDALRRSDTPTQEQHLERLKLRLSCDLHADDGDADFRAFATAYPLSASGHYLEGCWRLAKGDDSGIDSLERAISLDSDFTKPACERTLMHLSQRDDPRAGEYQQRWQARDQWERDVMPQMRTIDFSHELRDPALPEEQMVVIRGLVRAQAAGVARAYLARRVLPADPQARTYLLGLEMEPAPPRLEPPGNIVDRIATTGTWPVHVLVFALEGKNAALKSRLRELPGAEISLRG